MSAVQAVALDSSAARGRSIFGSLRPVTGIPAEYPASTRWQMTMVRAQLAQVVNTGAVSTYLHAKPSLRMLSGQSRPPNRRPLAAT